MYIFFLVFVYLCPIYKGKLMMETENLALGKSFQQALFSNDLVRASELLAENLMVENFFPHKSNKKAFIRAMQRLLSAMSDVEYTVIDIQVVENVVTMRFQVGGNHSQPLDFSFMKLPIIQPGNKYVQWPIMQWALSFVDGRITQIRNTASLNNGMLGILKAFGLKPPISYQIGKLLKFLGIGHASKKWSQTNKRSPLRFLPLVPLTVITTMILFVPSPIDPIAWTPQPIPPWVGPLTFNNELSKAELLGQQQLQHPEDIAFDDQGRIYTGSDDGNIYRITLNGVGHVETVQTFATVGGYPLGLSFDNAGNLIAAVKDIGLLSIDPAGNIELLTASIDGSPITYANSLVITEAGIIYFSDSSVKFDRGWPYDVLEARPNGRVLAYHPDTGATHLIKNDLYFPNGMVLAPDESYLLVNETTRYRIVRYWLRGERQGTWDYFVENLPMLPDNISMDEYGNYLVGGGKRISMIDRIQSSVFLKSQMAKIPIKILRNFPNLPPNRYGLILILNENGNIQQSLHDPSGTIYAISSARSHNGFIYIGTLLGTDLARYPYHP